MKTCRERTGIHNEKLSEKVSWKIKNDNLQNLHWKHSFWKNGKMHFSILPLNTAANSGLCIIMQLRREKANFCFHHRPWSIMEWAALAGA